MPIYEYQCRICGHQLEAFQSMSEKALTTCPACHAESLNKLISAAGFQLKGSGWYKTDYSTKGKSKSEDQSPKTEPAQSETNAQKSSTEATSKEKDNNKNKDKK